MHHAVATTLTSVDATFKSNKGVSSTYAILGSEVHQYLDEKADYPYSDGNLTSNKSTISIEMVNSKAAEPWPISDLTIETAAQLVAQILTRYGLKASETTITVHSQWSATACPGEYFMARYKDFVKRVQALMTPPSTKGNAIVWTLNKGQNQQWQLTSRSGGGLTITNRASGKLLDVSASNYTNGVQLITYDANGGLNQAFKVSEQRIGQVIALRLSPQASSNKSLSVNGGVYTNGTAVILWDNSDVADQLWIAIPVDGTKTGWIYLVSLGGLQSGQVLVLDASAT